MKTKIALLGSAPTSLPLAPFKDESWEIWGCSPGCAHFIRTTPGARVDRWFEIHHYIPPANEFNPDYIAWMKSLAPKPVYMIEAVEPIPNSVPYPKAKMVEEFGPFFWASSVSYMLALAISMASRGGAVKEIGMWGIDMSHVSEWAQQRPSCQHFVQLAWDRGIKITTPPESDLLWPNPMYGYHEAGPRAIKAYARQREMSAKRAEAEAKHAQSEREMFFFRGVCDADQYWMNTMMEEPDLVSPAMPARRPAHSAEEPTALASPALPAQAVEDWRVAQGLPSDAERRAHVANVTNQMSNRALQGTHQGNGLAPMQQQEAAE